MVARRLAPMMLVCGTVGGLVGYAVGLSSWPVLGAWITTASVTYVCALALVVVRGVLWARDVAEATDSVAAITLDLRQEFLRMKVAVILAGLAYAGSLVAPEQWASNASFSLACSGAVCGAGAIGVRAAYLGRGNTSGVGP
jgi:hypothetical protein